MSDTSVNHAPPDDSENKLTDSLAGKINAVIVQHFKDHGEDGARTRPIAIACATVLGGYLSQIEPSQACAKAFADLLLHIGESIEIARANDKRAPMTQQADWRTHARSDTKDH